MKKVLFLMVLVCVTILVFAESMKETIVARIDNHIIFASDVSEEFRMMGKNNPSREEQIQLIEGIIKNKILFYEAQELKDIKIAGDDVEVEVDKMIEKMRTSMGGETQFAQALAVEGLDLTTLRALYRKKIREEMFIQEYVEMKIRPTVSVSDDESETFYRDNKQMFKRGETYEYEVGMLKYAFGAEDEKRILQNLTTLRNEILKKKISFADAAKQFSQDGSAENGGDLGYVSRGQMVKEFEDVIYSLQKGELSKPFRSQFGYHLAYVDDIKGETRKTYHIIILPSPPQEKMDAFHANVKAQGSWENVKTWGKNLAMNFIPVGPAEREKINPLIVHHLESLKKDDISKPFYFNNAIIVVYLKNKSESTELVYADVKQRIKYVITDRKIKENIDKLYEKLKRKYYIEIML